MGSRESLWSTTIATYVQKTTNSDLSPSWPNTTAFDKEISAGTGSDGSVVVSLTAGQVKSGGFITPAGAPNSNAWEDSGTWTVEIEVDVSNHQIGCRVRCVRLDSAGNILQSGAFTGEQALSGTVSFSPVAPAWTDGEEDCDNRLAIEVEFIENQVMANSVTIGLGTAANEVVTDVTENVGCLDPFDWHVLPADVTQPIAPLVSEGVLALGQPPIIPSYGWFQQQAKVVHPPTQLVGGNETILQQVVEPVAPDLGWHILHPDPIREPVRTLIEKIAFEPPPVIPLFGWHVVAVDAPRGPPLHTAHQGFFSLIEVVAEAPSAPILGAVQLDTSIITGPGRTVGY